MYGHAVRCLVASLLLAISSTGTVSVVAQDSGEPLAGAESDWVGVPPPEDCTVEPITAQEYVDALSADTSESTLENLPFQIPTESDLPEGEPADDDTIEGISASLWESTACLNGGDFAKFLAFMSPIGVQFFLMSLLTQLGREAGPFTDEELTQYEANFTGLIEEEPEPFPIDERSSIEKIRDVRVLPSDQVLAVVDGRIGDVNVIFAVFTLADDRWLIDALGVIGELPEIQL